ncbi:MAG: MoaD/ThiS family protein [Lysobacteraceae bacterium]|jgi:molybdopterin synthase sulfur carrier subunit|uniref:MoaD/ThiS family protein n=1 Tax=Denitratimonas sp. CY0512 TaxID=3131940 RepID=UPI0016B68C38|nr:MoaD/ThiS family protein [Gammaproteobacteria bacterium]
MKVEVSLFGAFRDHEPGAQVVLELPEGARVAELRAALLDYAQAHWPAFRPGLLQRSAFASETTVLRDNELLPADGRMAVLPPVSGG